VGKDAYLIGFSAGKKTFTQTGAPDRFGLYDTGAASANLAVEATARGLYAHFMGGFDAQRARTEFGVPDDFDIGAAFVVGHLKDGGSPTPRSRKPLEELVLTPRGGNRPRSEVPPPGEMRRFGTQGRLQLPAALLPDR